MNKSSDIDVVIGHLIETTRQRDVARAEVAYLRKKIDGLYGQSAHIKPIDILSIDNSPMVEKRKPIDGVEKTQKLNEKAVKNKATEEIVKTKAVADKDVKTKAVADKDVKIAKNTFDKSQKGATKNMVNAEKKLEKELVINALHAAGIKKPCHFEIKQKWYAEFALKCAEQYPRLTAMEIREYGKRIYSGMSQEDKAPWKLDFNKKMAEYLQHKEETTYMLITEPKEAKEANVAKEAKVANVANVAKVANDSEIGYQSCTELPIEFEYVVDSDF